MANAKWLSKKQAAEYLSVSEKTIDRLRARGELDSVPLTARLVRISVASLEALVERRRANSRLAAPADPFPIPALDAIRARKAEAPSRPAGYRARP